MITLEQACGLALEADTALQQDAIDLGLAKSKAGALWAQVFPTISADAGLAYNFPLKDTVQQDRLSYSASVGLSLRFNAGLPYVMQSVKLAYRQGLLNMESARRRLVLAVSKSFYSLAAKEQNLSVLENNRVLALSQLERDTAAWRSGYRGEIEYLQSRLSAESARLNYEKALAEYRNSLEEFCAALGLDQADNIRLSGGIETARLSLDAEKLILDYLPGNPSLAARRSSVEQLSADEKQQMFSARVPSLSLSASWGAQGDKNFDWKSGDSVQTRLTLSIPLNSWIPRTKESQELDAASARVQKARLDVRDAEEKAKREIRSLCANLETLWDEMGLSQLRLEIAERTYTLSEEAYRAGTVSFLDYESARNRFVEANQQFLTSVLNYKLLSLDLAASLNVDEAELRTIPER